MHDVSWFMKLTAFLKVNFLDFRYDERKREKKQMKNFGCQAIGVRPRFRLFGGGQLLLAK